MCFNFIARDFNRSAVQIKDTHTHTSRHLVATLGPAERERERECVFVKTGSKKKKVHICASACVLDLQKCVCVCTARSFVFGHAQEYMRFLSWKKDRQPGLQDRRGWKGCSHMLCPDKTHLFGLGLPLPPSLHSEAASFSASGLSRLRWVSAFRNTH